MTLAPTSSHSGGGDLRVATATLTDAQVKALPVTDVQLIAAPGSGLALVPIHALIYLKWTADYMNIDAAANLRIRTAPGSAELLNNLDNGNADANVDTLLANGDDETAVFGPIGRNNQFAGDKRAWPNFHGALTQSWTNRAVVLHMANGALGALTGGDAANALLVAVTYYTLTMP